MDLGTRIWHPPQILQGRMTSSPIWQGRESLGSRSVVTSNAQPNVFILSTMGDRKSNFVFALGCLRLAYKSSSKSRCLIPCLEARSAIVRARASERARGPFNEKRATLRKPMGCLCKCMRNKSRLAAILFLCRANLPRFDARIWPHFHVKTCGHTSPLPSTHKLACRAHF